MPVGSGRRNKNAYAIITPLAVLEKEGIPIAFAHCGKEGRRAGRLCDEESTGYFHWFESGITMVRQDNAERKRTMTWKKTTINAAATGSAQSRFGARYAVLTGAVSTKNFCNY